MKYRLYNFLNKIIIAYKTVIIAENVIFVRTFRPSTARCQQTSNAIIAYWISKKDTEMVTYWIPCWRSYSKSMSYSKSV